MSDRSGCNVTRSVGDAGRFVVTTLVSCSAHLGSALLLTGTLHPLDWLAVAGTGVFALGMILLLVVSLFAIAARYRQLLRSRARATAGRSVQCVTIAQLHTDLVPRSELGWLVLDRDQLTFTPDPELPSLVDFRRMWTWPEPGAVIQIPPIPRDAIVQIASMVVPKAGIPLLRVRWRDPATGRETARDFRTFERERHQRWVEAVSAPRVRLDRRSRLTRAGSLPRALARFRVPAAADPSPADRDQRRDALAKSKYV